MDEMALLERFRSDVEIDTSALVRSRRRVMRHALAKAGVTRRRRRLLLATAATVAAFAITMSVTGGPNATPAAAAVLTRAAATVEESAAPRPGEYLHVRETTTRWSEHGQETTIQERWIPGNDDPPIFRDFEGFVYLNRSPLPEIYHRSPLTNEELLEWLRRPNGDLRGEDAAYERVGEVLASDLAPSSFQGALFTALRSISGVSVVDDHAVFGGQDAVIIGRAAPMEAQFAFDGRTGRFLGMQGAGNPDVGRVLSYRTVTETAIVDRLPPRAQPDDPAQPTT